jgi:hypothetical protein
VTTEERKAITEKDKDVLDSWYQEARNITPDQLPEFLHKLMTQYRHDYGTVCHALAAGAVATCWAMNSEPQGGITGFQAGAVMWEFIKHWLHQDGPMKLLQYEDFLFPQMVYKFRNTNVSKATLEWLQQEAKKKLDEKSDFAHPEVKAHWEMLAEGRLPEGFAVVED